MSFQAILMSHLPSYTGTLGLQTGTITSSFLCRFQGLNVGHQACVEDVVYPQNQLAGHGWNFVLIFSDYILFVHGGEVSRGLDRHTPRCPAGSERTVCGKHFSHKMWVLETALGSPD